MPFVYDPNLDDDQEDASTVQISGASPSADFGGTTGNTSGPEAAKNTGSGFQNLDKYLQTNQAQEFGQQVAGKVQGKVDSARQNIDQAAQTFGQKVQSANELPDQSQINSSIANPTSADAKQFQNWENQTYTGPHNLAESQDDYNKFWSGTNQANTEASLLGTEPGRFSLLDSYFGKPTYNFGQKSLDNLLIQQGGIGEQTKGLQDQAAQLKTYGTDQAKSLQNQAGVRAGQVDQSRASVRQAIGLDDQNNVITGDNAGAIGKQYKQVDDALAQTNASRKAQLEKIQQGLSSGLLDSDQLASLGLSPGQSIYDINLNSYLTPGSDLNKQQTMTAEQQSYIQALSQLAGITDTYASGALQGKTDPYSYDKSRLLNDVGAKGAEYQRLLKESPVTLTNPDGSKTIRSMHDIETDINSYYTDKANGYDSSFGRKFISYAEPALAAAKAQLANQFQVNRKISMPTVQIGGGGLGPR